jgi:glutamate/tyrosine decarboxylase-like PLP-dependent enzyme
MSTRSDDYRAVLAVAEERAGAWLSAVGSRRVAPTATAEELRAVFGVPLQDGPTDPVAVVTALADGAEPGLMAIGSGRFFGWVMGGTFPAALGADWLVSAWDQNTGIRYATPAAAAIEEAAASWVLDLLGLPADAGLGFTTGATMANFTCLAAARSAVLRTAGWDVAVDGLAGGPRVHVLVGEERHETVDLALRYLGLGTPAAVAADGQGRLQVDALRRALDAVPDGEPLIVALQAGNVHSGAFDPFAEAVDLVHARGGWVHVDGAFGLWAAACRSMADLVPGLLDADSWTTDAHKTLSVPYDCGVAVVRDRSAMRAALGLHASYLIDDTTDVGDPHERVPELSRRARGVPVWAAIRSLGRRGVVELVEGLARHARSIAAGAATIPGATVLNDVVFTQVCIAFEDDERTRAVTRRLLADGTTWMSGSRWHGRDVLRVSVSNFSTDEEDVRRSVEALRRAAAEPDPGA